MLIKFCKLKSVKKMCIFVGQSVENDLMDDLKDLLKFQGHKSRKTFKILNNFSCQIQAPTYSETLKNLFTIFEIWHGWLYRSANQNMGNDLSGTKNVTMKVRKILEKRSKYLIFYVKVYIRAILYLFEPLWVCFFLLLKLNVEQPTSFKVMLGCVRACFYEFWLIGLILDFNHEYMSAIMIQTLFSDFQK